MSGSGEAPQSRPIALPELADLLADLLAEGHPVRLPVWGTSMLPLLQSGDVVQVAPAVGAEVSRGEVVACRGQDGGLLVHRLVARDRDWLVLWPDAGLGLNGPLPGEALLGRVVGAEREGQAVSFARRVPGYVRGMAWAVLQQARRPWLWALLRYPLRLAARLWLALPALRGHLGRVPGLGGLLKARQRRRLAGVRYRRVPAGPPPQDQDWVWIAVLGERVLGQLTLDRSLGEQLGRPSRWISGGWVDPWWRGGGLLGGMVAQALAQAREEGVEEVFGAIRRGNVPSRRACSRQGFVECDDAELQAAVDRWYAEVAGWPPGTMVVYRVRLDAPQPRA